MAVGDEYLASVRHSVRLSSTVHDGELTDLINAARADLVLGGVLEAKANDETDPLSFRGSAARCHCCRRQEQLQAQLPPMPRSACWA